MSSSLTRMTAFWPPDDPLVLSRMALEGRASRFHCCLANGRLRRILVIAGPSGEGPLTEPTAAARPWRRKPLTLRANARHHPRIGILGGEQLVHHAQPRAALAPSLSRNLR